MALPTTNLTLHLDASDTDKLFTTWVDGGSHTGTPADNGTVQAWSAETDGSVTPAHAAYGGAVAGREPNYRSGTPLMLLPCLDFDGTEDELRLVNNTNSTTYYNTGSFMGDAAKTIIFAAWPESITLEQADPVENHIVVGTSNDFVVGFKIVSTVKKAFISNHDGAWKTVTVNATEGAANVVCARQDGSNLYISVDGGAESSVASGATATWPSGELRIGRGSGSGRLHGRIGELAIYSAALTGADLTDAIAYFRAKWQGIGGSGTEALAGSAITPGHGTQTPGISISI
jgi:hypothetical protein